MTLITPVVTGKWPKEEASQDPGANQSHTLFAVLSAIDFGLMLGVYVGSIVVVVGVFLMPVPKEVYPSGEVPVSPAVQCTIWLTSLYFIVYFCEKMLTTLDTHNQTGTPSRALGIF